MSSETPDIPKLAADFSATHLAWSPSRQRLALALFRLLGQGEPVTRESLAERAGIPLDEVAAFIDQSPTTQRDEPGNIIAFGGLTLLPTSHVLEVDGRALHAWCALDTLFLPELLARPARVRSTCPATGQPVTLTVDIDGVHDLAPAGAVMTLHTVDGLDPNDVVGTFCCFVHFFVTEQAARDWARPNPGTYTASITDGFEYGRLYNQARYGAALTTTSTI